jgi:hypothetical protein
MRSSTTQKDDLAFGTNNETAVLETLQTFFGSTLQRQGGYEVMDYTNPGRTIYVELKTRRIPHDRYPTAIIGLNKIQWCQKDPSKEYHFVFCYTDGLFTLKYDEALFKNFQREIHYFRGEREDCPNAAQSIVYIPSNLLRKV